VIAPRRTADPLPASGESAARRLGGPSLQCNSRWSRLGASRLSRPTRAWSRRGRLQYGLVGCSSFRPGTPESASHRPFVRKLRRAICLASVLGALALAGQIAQRPLSAQVLPQRSLPSAVVYGFSCIRRTCRDCQQLPDWRRFRRKSAAPSRHSHPNDVAVRLGPKSRTMPLALISRTTNSARPVGVGSLSPSVIVDRTAFSTGPVTVAMIAGHSRFDNDASCVQAHSRTD
jgi:hypothetical protein